MRIAVISDLHLGAGGHIDQFQHDETRFLKFLDFLEDNFERIILLGDVYETLMPLQFGDTRSALAQCRDAHREIVARFDRPKYTYIHGNHDWVAAEHLRAPEELRLAADGQRIIFRHGHQYDGLIKQARFVSEFGVWLGGWVLRIGLWPIYRIITRLDEGSAAHVLTSLEKLAIESCPAADIVVTGHTHVPKRAEIDSKLYLNSGTCSNGRFSFLSIDTKTGTYETHTAW
jgi:predicted phosphodiesterase